MDTEVEQYPHHVNLPFLPSPDDMKWRSQSACIGSGVDFFTMRAAAVREQKALCMTCPVLKDCLDFAIRNNEQDGTWGGLTEKERKELYRDRQS